MAKIKNKFKHRPIPKPAATVEHITVYTKEGRERFKVTKQEYDQFLKQEYQMEVKRAQLEKHIQPMIDKNVLEVMAKPDIVRFIPYKRVKLENFTTREAFDKHMMTRKEHLRPDFYESRAEIYRENIITAINKEHPGLADELIGNVEKLNADQLQYLMVRHPQEFNVGFIYDMPKEQRMRILNDMNELVIKVLDMTYKQLVLRNLAAYNDDLRIPLNENTPLSARLREISKTATRFK